ncbi:MAG: energy-coupling factor transporter transmembrane protein EcfT [Alphaproteobacteria bacterium]|nr:energy-coupling factor transporter transmembrane protein EcfT [Alphaproteobacteria bacterium]
MLIDGLAPPSWLHPVRAGVKLAALAALSLVLLALDDWRSLAGALFAILLVSSSLGRGSVGRLSGLWRLAPLILLVGALQALAGGWNAGAVVSLRLLALLLLAELVTMTTSTSAMMDALTPLLRLMRPLGVNPRKVALAVALVLRFVPLLVAQWREREEAWKARSTRRVPLHLVAVFVADVLLLADRVGEALDARGFDSGASPPHSPTPRG